MKLSERIKAFMDNPDDLSILAEAHTQAIEVEKNEGDYQLRIDKLQSTNRSLLKMIPQAEVPTPTEEKPEVVEYNLETGVKSMQALIEGE